MKKAKIISITIGVVGLISLLFGTTMAFFNYTKTGSANTLAVGRIYFNTSQDGQISLTNVFPITSEELEGNTTDSDSITITITGDTTYANGIEYVVRFTDVNNTVNNKDIPISYILEVDDLGTESNTYWSSRGGSSSVYKIKEEGTIHNNEKILVGYIKPDNNGVNGSITITAFVDADKMAISDTYDGTESSEMGTTNDWVNGRIVFTTAEWSSLNTNGISFKVQVEANQGIWVSESENLGDRIKSRLGSDGIVAVNTNGDLYSGTGEIREYRYSGIGNYCTYTDGTNNYNISVEGLDCPTIAYKNSNGAVSIGTSDYYLYNSTDGLTVLTRVNETATDSGLRNYVMFDNERWRIIGVFGDNVKIMKDLPLLENVTDNPVTNDEYYADEYQEYTNTLNEKFYIKYIAYSPPLKYGMFSINDYSTTYTSFRNHDDWTSSGLMYYLNETNTGSYYSTLDEKYKNIIDTVTYYLGNVTTKYNSDHYWVMTSTAKQLYVEEHGNIVCPGSLGQYSSDNNCNIWVYNKGTWNGKVGLIYPSDFGYATTTDKWSTSVGTYYKNGGSLNNWMFNTDSDATWMISPAAFNWRNETGWDYNGVATDFRGYFDYTVRPALFLISTTEITDGDGSYSNPYTLDVN